MLVFVSDLHFVDGTAGEHNVPVEAFRGTFQDLATHAKNAKAEEVIIVFLGDIFDLLRTEKWFEVTEEQRPWGATDRTLAGMEANARAILGAIVGHKENQRTFDFLNGNLVKSCGFPVEPQRVYLTGSR